MSNNKKNNINKLTSELSSYLQLHASNPVKWYPWGKEAFEKARVENKPIIVSIGYSSCHWCHVMNNETFSDIEVAKIMNDNFVSIKVDREERPDVDKIYMEALNLMQVQGGWPLNCFLLPDGRPFWGGTYFSLNDWKDLLVSIKNLYDVHYQRVESHAQYLTNQLKITTHKAGVVNFNEKDTSLLHKIHSKLRLNLDFRDGGFAYLPKFPMPINLLYNIRYGFLFSFDEAIRHSLLTLEKIGMGGIYDQLCGGFSRYSTDVKWKLPHFEKMLYDNALLISSYSEAYMLKKNKFFKHIIMQTIEFVKNEMMSKNYMFFSSIDADSEGVEGKYYVWSRSEIFDILGKDAGIFCKFYGVDGEGYWEDEKNILLMPESVKDFTYKHYLDCEDFAKTLINCRKKLLKYRRRRIKPFVDKKVITSWNFLMLKAFVDAYSALGNKEYLNIAKQNVEFSWNNIMMNDGDIYHVFYSNKALIKGFLDDYAYAIDAFIALYKATFNEKYIFKANSLMQYVFNNFEIDEQGLFLYSCDKTSLMFVNKSESFDNVLPSANSSIANSLFFLSIIFENKKWEEQCYNMLKAVMPLIVSNPVYYPNWCLLLCKINSSKFLIRITGKNAYKKAHNLNKYYYPSNIIIASETKSEINCLKQLLNENNNCIIICDEKKCFHPVKSVKEAKKIIEQGCTKYF